MSKTSTPTPETETPRLGLFLTEYADNAEFLSSQSGTTINRFKKVDTADDGKTSGRAKIRILGDQVAFLQHRSIPESVATKRLSVPCRKRVTDWSAYRVKDNTAYVESLGKCEFCDYHKANSAVYKPYIGYAFNFVQDGQVVIADFHQRTVLDGIRKVLTDKDNADAYGPNGVVDVEINFDYNSKAVKGTPMYSFTVPRSSKPLTKEMVETYLETAFDLNKLYLPPDFTIEGDAKWDKYLDIFTPPEPGAKPKPYGG